MRLALPLAALLFSLAPCVCQSKERVPPYIGGDLETPPGPAIDESQEPWTSPPPPPQDTDSAGPVPEPSTFLLLSTGIVGIALTTRRRRKQTSRA